MNRPQVFVSRRIPENGIERLRAVADVEVWSGQTPPPRAELLEAVAGCDGFLSMLSDRVDAELLDAAGSQLRVISNFAVGHNNIDLAAAAERGVRVGNTPDVLTDATADVAVLLVLAAARRAKEATAAVRDGDWKTWDPTGLLGVDLVDKTLGIVGMGRIGAATAARLVGGWGMQLIYASRTPKPEIDQRWGAQQVSFSQLLAESDFVSVHADLNPSTKKMFNRKAFVEMKSDAVLVNTSRGDLIDQAALVEALKSGQIRACGLDVTTPEPLSPDDDLVKLPNCFILPHIGSATDHSRAAMAEIAADNVIAGIEGKPLRCEVAP